MVTQGDRCAKGAGSMGLTPLQKEEHQLPLSLPAHPNSPFALQHHSQLPDSETPAQDPTPSGRAGKQDGAPRGISDFSPASGLPKG